MEHNMYMDTFEKMESMYNRITEPFLPSRLIRTESSNGGGNITESLLPSRLRMWSLNGCGKV